MIWDDGIGWHWLGSLAMGLFWALIIVLALAPIKYLRKELGSPELLTAPPAKDTAPRAASPHKR